MRRVGIVLFDRFEVLDVFGPVELLSMADGRFELEFLGPAAGPVASAQGVEVLAQRGYADAAPADIVLVPGGPGTRTLVSDRAFLDWLGTYSARAELTASVCTGSAVLAAAGLLAGYRATSNKAAFGWVREQGQGVTWVPEARWVEDRDRWTSSGVAAGMDMTAALIRHLHGPELAEAVAAFAELEVRQDPAWDPFARRHGLV